MTRRWPVAPWLMAILLAIAPGLAGGRPASGASPGAILRQPSLGPGLNDPAPPDSGASVWQPQDADWIGPPADVSLAPNPFSESSPALPGLVRIPASDGWLYRPFSVSGFAGGLFADDPVDGRLDAGTGFFAGFRIGWDYAPRWGMETRFGFSKFALEDPRQIQLLSDERVFLWDVDWVFYPWGDTPWRPYLLAGVGLADIDLTDELNNRLHETLFGVPLGGGIKLHMTPRLACRFEFLDNVAFGQGSRLETMHNLSATASLEIRFGGGPRRSYWPWEPGHHWW